MKLKWILLLVAFLVCPALADLEIGRGPGLDPYYWRWPNGIGIRWMQGVNDAIENGTFPGTGDVFYVDSNVSVEGDGSSWTNAKDTLQEAIDLCAASNGDVIYVAQGHAESYGDAEGFDLDAIGATVFGCGSGALRPTFTFTHADAQCTIGTASCMIMNCRFLAGVTGVKVGIEVEAAADDCAIVNCDFPEPGTAEFEFLTTIEIETTVDRLTVAGCTAYSADQAGATQWILMTAGVNNGTRILYNTVFGDYSEAIVYSDDADLETQIIGGQYTNINAGEYCFYFSANATGWIDDVLCSTDVYTTCVDPGLMATGFDCVWFDYDLGSNATAVPMFSFADTSVYDFDLATNNLDHLMKVAVSNTGTIPEVTDASLMGVIMTKTDGDVSDFDFTTDSLEAIADALNTGLGLDHFISAVVSDTSDHVDMQEIEDDSILANILAIDGDIADYDRRYDSLEALGDDTDAIIADFTDYTLDHLAAVTTSVVADASLQDVVIENSILAHMMSNDANTGDFDASTDSLEAIAVALAAGTGVTTAMDADDLDHLINTSTGAVLDADMSSVVEDLSILAHLMSDSAVIDDYDASTDSLEAISNMLTTGTGALSGIRLDHLAYLSTGVVADADMSGMVSDLSILAHLMTTDATTADWDCSTQSLQAIAADGDAIVIDTAELQGLFTDGGTIDVNFTKILADTAELQTLWTDGGALDTNMVAIKADTAAILLDTGELQTLWKDGGALDVNLVAIKTETAAIYADSNAVDYWRPHMASCDANAGNYDLFDVDGGPIEILAFYGYVTTSIDSNAASVEIILDADSPVTDYDFSTAVPWTSDALGTRYTFDNTTTEAVLTPCEGADKGGAGSMTGWFCGEGMIEQAVDVANDDGAVTWYMKWVPLEAGVTVTAQ